MNEKGLDAMGKKLSRSPRAIELARQPWAADHLPIGHPRTAPRNSVAPAVQAKQADRFLEKRAAPSVYQPFAVRVQTKSAVNFQETRPAPPVYRPYGNRPDAGAAQRKKINGPSAPRPVPQMYRHELTSPGMLPKVAGPPKLKNQPAPPAVYCPHPAPETVQMKMAMGRSPGVRNTPGLGVDRVPEPQPALRPPARIMASAPMQLKAIAARPAVTVIQCGRFKSEKTGTDFVVTPGTKGSRSTLTVTAYGASEVLATMEYQYYGSEATMLHVEAYGMPSGTGAGYLLFYLFAKQAKSDGKTTITIGTGVDKKSSTRNLESAREENDAEKIKTAQQSLAAVHIYEALGFDATDAVTLSKSSMSVDQVILLSRAKAGKWKRFVGGGCFLTSACTRARQLPDDCEELTVLRAFRDGYLWNAPGGQELIERYYAIAPVIVAAIDHDPDRRQILEGIFHVIGDCVSAIKSSRMDDALHLYSAMVCDLEQRYCEG
ncbi:MAG TPA: CFI-box-CTERM domain-containing protein [Candidatus Saccharimonadales bacterium]|jgi:hypothetical protein|nr:CFI-box-CTERM domain-containing protein [Candidatus Saccharimonadales bacterium]